VFVGVVLCQSLPIYGCRDGHHCCSGALVLCDLSTMISRLSTKTNLLRQALSDSSDGRAMTAARLQLVLVSVVVARWYKYQFVILLTF
jgi:hypothetical protein